jgi:hypothetical protein
MAIEGFRALDFTAYHRDELPRLLDAGRGALAAKALGSLGSLAFRMPDGAAFTYQPSGKNLTLREGDAEADTVIALERESWEGLVHDYESAPGLLYSSRARCAKGDAIQLVLWEPALRALYLGRPVYDSDEVLLDRHGRELDTAQVFRTADDAADMAHFLRTTGYLVVRRVFDKDETAAFLREARELRTEAAPGDGASWWAKGGDGTAILCRVTSGRRKSHLDSLFGEPRVQRLVQFGEPDAVASAGEGDGITVIYKNAGVSEGLSDLPWHRDCGLGGHSLMCPRVIASIYLTPANQSTGDLVFLPGSWKSSCGYMDPAVLPMRAVRISAEPGDVTIHYGDVMHAAPPPALSDLAEYRISVVTDYSRPDVRNHRGLSSYNAQLHRRDDGQVEHLAAVTKRA